MSRAPSGAVAARSHRRALARARVLLASGLGLWALSAPLLGCGDGSQGADAGPPSDAGPRVLCDPPGEPDPGACTTAPQDYRPGAEDAFAPCVSDDGFYHRIEPTISTISRVEAFEEIAALLFEPTRDAPPDDFLAARVVYQRDEGLDSRLVRRYDPHFAAPDGTDCTLPGAPATYPGYCVGAARLQPTVLDALARGLAGDDPRAQAARIEGALLWFLYVSAYKEALTCTTTPRDCDSSYAYYTGGAEARCGLGLSRYVVAVDPWAHDRAWDGVLALRCWRALDPGDTATDLGLRDRAVAQLDRAVLHGVAQVVRDRLARLAATTGDERRYHHVLLQTLGPVLDRALRAADPAAADALAAALAETDPAAVDVAGADAAIATVFVCP